jgi:hypothetical protein
MGSLLASYLMGALLAAAVGFALGYDAAIETMQPPGATSESHDVRQSALAHINRQELPRAVQPPAHGALLPSLLPLHGVSLQRAQINAFVVDSHSAENPTASVQSAPVVRSLIGNAVHIEMPRIDRNGHFVRPKIVLGLVSPEIKGWLRSQGIAAENCMFPMLRARARLNHESREVSAGVTLHARCSFY